MSLPTLTEDTPTRVWCDHGARRPLVASHVDEQGRIRDVIGRAGTQEEAVALIGHGAEPTGKPPSVVKPSEAAEHRAMT